MTLIINGKTYEAGEFIAYVKTLEKENAELKQAEKGKVVEHFEAYGQCRDSRRIAELEKENAELKEKLNFSTQYYQGEKAKDQLTKAKEYIKLLLMNCVGVYESTGKTVAEIQAEAEQFLKENA